MTDLTRLALPAWAGPAPPRREAVDEHEITINGPWWREAVTARRLPGTPPSGPTLTRAEVWAAASDDVFTLLWRSLAWGSGRYLRLNARRLDSIAADVPRASSLLTRAAEVSRRDPLEAYTLLRPGPHNAIRSLGPSFFTKFLYFAGGGAPDHPCLILDRVVATALRDRCGWTSLHRTGPWPAETYGRYCDLLTRWAQAGSWAPDEIERALFAGGQEERS
ncbi:hypothetical protein [Lentzea sp. NBRC 102530]|uniref:8-oxoguanine DNA glycosylase OGG fold protein n=1 Tax=Lentzea sp. NBRC 102530 TaxID=3032201 RepID=UPI0024A3085F|nr:hypothetical protein [Lentzea sp. NBRC 102530]GLY48665.1 hypothetical protein Lesp01_23210 [Lentzea sp. NBRC 102530]